MIKTNRITAKQAERLIIKDRLTINFGLIYKFSPFSEAGRGWSLCFKNRKFERTRGRR
jgi:hypothetical protein